MTNHQSGIAGILLIFLILFFFIGALIGFDYGYIEYTTRCGDTPIGECLQATPTPTPSSETTVTAMGNFSKKSYNVTITMNIPLEGGVVVGNFDGDCTGTINGNFDGNDNGTISGKAYGSCSLGIPIPASATFTGTVNKQAKTVPITGQGSAVGVSGSGSLTLTF